MSYSEPRTLFEKIWSRHEILTRDDGVSLLSIDRHLCHEGSFHAFDKLKMENRTVRCRNLPSLSLIITYQLASQKKEMRWKRSEYQSRNSKLIQKDAGIRLYGVGSKEQGIVHVVGPEQGLTIPGITLVCGDSHTATHGAFGCLAFGIGASEVAHVLATQTLWQTKPKTMRININGSLSDGVVAKDIILHLISVIGANGASGHMIEYAGSTIRNLSMEGRMTICNMSIEAGGRAGMVEPDQKTFDYLKGRKHAPKLKDWDLAIKDWKTLATEPRAIFDKEVTVDAGEIAPSLTWGNSPEETLPVTGYIRVQKTKRTLANEKL